GALALLADEDALNAEFAGYPDAFEKAMADAFFQRLGLKRRGEDDFALVVALLQWMEETRVPFERIFFDWFGGETSLARVATSPLSSVYADAKFAPVRARVLATEPDCPERLNHAYFARAEPTTMLIDEVEAIWAAIAEKDDWSRLYAKLDDIAVMREAFGFDPSQYG
ncbi:MAG TPA: protein adenylyltransferase SelO family protein, partial [Parvularculaceae bacterium]|nr:protein adenylyltransferase SelO family protein [Parvularculaceae bacterium]